MPSYYEHMNGRAPGAGRGVDFIRTLRKVTRGLRKLYPSTPMLRISLLADDMRAIRAVMQLDDLKDLTYCARLASQFQGVMRSSNILRPSDGKARRWDPKKDTHVGRITWEDVDPAANGGRKTRMRWRLKPSKTDPGGEKRFEKTFLVDGDRNAISDGFAISSLLHMRGYRDDWNHLNTPLFTDPETGKEVTIASSRKLLGAKVKEAGLSPQHVKGDSLRIRGGGGRGGGRRRTRIHRKAARPRRAFWVSGHRGRGVPICTRIADPWNLQD